jgi:ribosome maturation factor RimP
METANSMQQAATKKKVGIGERINIETSNGEEMSGKIVKIGKDTITLRNGCVDIKIDLKVVKEMGWKITAAPPIPENKTIEFACEKAKEIMGPATVAFGAKNDSTYSGKIVGLTEGYAIQAINDRTAVLHRLKNFAKGGKDAKGQIKVREGENLKITRDSFGVVSVAPYHPAFQVNITLKA